MAKGKVIERKFLLREHGQDYATDQLDQLYPSVEDLRNDVTQKGKQIIQGYIPDMKTALAVAKFLKIGVDFIPVEAGFRRRNSTYTFGIKGPGGDELEKNVRERFYIRNCVLTSGHRLHKTRLTVPCKGHRVGVDVYKDTDLITAEVGFETLEEAEKFAPLGKDVSTNPKYEGRTIAGIV